jgi:hypothetical protein
MPKRPAGVSTTVKEPPGLSVADSLKLILPGMSMSNKWVLLHNSNHKVLEGNKIIEGITIMHACTACDEEKLALHHSPVLGQELAVCTVNTAGVV